MTFELECDMKKFILSILISCAFSQTIDWNKQIKNKPIVDVRDLGCKGDNVTNNASCLQSAINAVPLTGGIVIIPPGKYKYNATLNVGDGSGVTDSTRQNINIVGSGLGTELIWTGGASTMININGPMHSVSVTNVTLNANSLATKYINIYATEYGNFEKNKYINLAASGIGITIEAGAGFNANSRHNSFSYSHMEATSSGSSCYKIGMTPTNFNSGNFQNTFFNAYCTYANDTVNSIAIELGWADNNNFSHMELVSVTRPGSGFAVKNDRQAGSYNWLPSENVFIHTTLCGDPSCNGFTGNAGLGVGNVYWPYQAFDSGGIGHGSGYLGARGWISNGDFFDTAAISRFAFQNYLTIYSQTNLAALRLLGFSGLVGSGTIQSTGTALVGTGTSFLTQPGVGKMIVVQGNEFRYLTAVADNTHATLSSAFTDDQPAGTVYLYQTGANGFIFSDSNLNVGVQDASQIRFWSSGAQVAYFDQFGNLYSIAGIFPSNNNVQIRSGLANPEGSLVGNIGDLYMRKGGGTGATLYVKETGDGLNTGWVAK